MRKRKTKRYDIDGHIFGAPPLWNYDQHRVAKILSKWFLSLTLDLGELTEPAMGRLADEILFQIAPELAEHVRQGCRATKRRRGELEND